MNTGAPKDEAKQAAPPTGRIAVNLRRARDRFREGGFTLVLKLALAKSKRLTRRRVGARLAATANRLDDHLPPVLAADFDSSVFELMRAGFDPAWYVAFYGLHVSAPPTAAFEHYIAIGARHGFSPSASFDEIAYRTAYPEASQEIARGLVLCGYLDYQLRGKAAKRKAFAVADRAHDSAAFAMHGPIAGLVREEFDPDWYVDAYGDVTRLLAAGAAPSPLWHYITEGMHTGRSPNAWFDEQWYLQTYTDVAAAKAIGETPNAFVHFLRFGRNEGRRTNSTAPKSLEDSYSGLTRPVGIDRLAVFDQLLEPFAYRVYPANGTPRVNFMVPTLDKDLMFAGYIAGLNFIKRLLDRGWQVRLLILDDANATPQRLRKQFSEHPLGMSVLGRAEVVNLARRQEILDITTDDSFVAYSMWVAHHADIFASAVGRRFVFFLQEFEPAFHLHDSLHAIGTAMYGKPHFALFNSDLLRRHFRNERLGVYGAGEEEGSKQCAVFEHALSIPRPPMPDELVRGATRRLLFYARPEAHAARNLFEIGVMALRRAVADGAFDEGDWTFDGVGSLATETSIKLGKGKFLTIKPRLTLGAYAQALRGYEVGLSMQYAPHPGVVHFEMALSGMVTVTNTFTNRSPADLLAISSNLVPVEPSIEAVALGLAEATARSRDVGACVRGATGTWSTSWEQSFDEEVMSAVEAEFS